MKIFFIKSGICTCNRILNNGNVSICQELVAPHVTEILSDMIWTIEENKILPDDYLKYRLITL